MIVIDKRKLRFLLAGHPLTITPINASRYRQGRDYALGTNHRRSICRVLILERGDDLIRVRLHHDDAPRLLAAHSEYGYTDDPFRAMRHEPEAVGPEAQHGLTEQGTRRWTQERAKREAERQLMTLHERLRTLERHYANGETQLEADLRVIRARIQAIRKNTAT